MAYLTLNQAKDLKEKGLNKQKQAQELRTQADTIDGQATEHINEANEQLDELRSEAEEQMNAETPAESNTSSGWF